MTNEASSYDRDRRAFPESTRGMAGTMEVPARGGDAIGGARKIEKVVHYDAFWCMTCGAVRGGAQHVVVGSQVAGLGCEVWLHFVASNDSWREEPKKIQKVMQNDAF